MSSNPPTQNTYAAGQLVHAADMTALADGIHFWNGDPRSGQPRRPICKVQQTVAQSIPNSSDTAILFDSEVVDTDSGHSTTTNTSRYTAATAGWYDVKGLIMYAANTTGIRQAVLKLNGSFQYAEDARQATSAFEVGVNVSDTIFMNVGDYVELFAYQSSGGALNTATSRCGSRMSIRLISV